MPLAAVLVTASAMTFGLNPLLTTIMPIEMIRPKLLIKSQKPMVHTPFILHTQMHFSGSFRKDPRRISYAIIITEKEGTLYVTFIT